MSIGPPDVPDPKLAAIGREADAAAERIAEAGSIERIQVLEARLADIEPLLEQLQANASIGPELAIYVRQLRAEQRFFNVARWVVGGAAFVAILLLTALLLLALLSSSSPLLKAAPAAIAAFVLGIVSGIVFLLNSFTKGVFRSTAKRHADGFLPPALEKGAEIYGKLMGR